MPSNVSPDVRAYLEEQLAEIALLINQLLIDVAAGGGGGASELSDLTDVNTSTPTNRNVLVADGVDFESRALVEADVSDLGTYIETVDSPNLTGQWTFDNLDTNKLRLTNTPLGVDISRLMTMGWVGSNKFTFDFTSTSATVEFVNVSNRYNFDAEIAAPSFGIGTWDIIENGNDLQMTYVGNGGEDFRFVRGASYVNSYLLAQGQSRYGRDCDIRDGNSLFVRDTADTDWAEFSHDGTDFNINFVNTTDVNLTNAAGYKIDGNDIANSDGTTGGAASAGAGNQYVELVIGATTYKVLHDGTV